MTTNIHCAACGSAQTGSLRPHAMTGGVFDPDGVLAVEWLAGDGGGQGLYL
jgi:hypothetical protein